MGECRKTIYIIPCGHRSVSPLNAIIVVGHGIAPLPKYMNKNFYPYIEDNHFQPKPRHDFQDECHCICAKESQKDAAKKPTASRAVSNIGIASFFDGFIIAQKRTFIK